MEQREIQQTFIRSAIRVIAKKGLVKATTKAIAADAGLNETYIYKCFKGKDELLAEALHDRDEGLAVFLRREFPNVLAETSPWRERCFHLWEKTWKFILDKRDDCIFYLRYYSSPDFYAYEHDRQQQYYHALIQRVAYLFRPETDLDMLMHQVFETMLAFAVHVMAGDMENNDLTTERTFEQIYSFIAPHFRAELTEGAGKETAVL